MAVVPLPPQIIAPVSPCSRAIEIRGLIPGARVEVFNEGALVVDETADATSAIFPILSGRTLAPRTKLVPHQSLPSGESSPTPDSDLTVEVMLQPTRADRIGQPVWTNPLYRCARCVLLEGAYPGAEVDLRDSTGVSLGRRRVVGTVARIGLSRDVRGLEVLEARQQACGVDSGSRQSGQSANPPNPLPPPRIGGPLLACSRRIAISNVVVGAEVEVRRTPSGKRHRGCFDAPSLYIPLSEADKLEPMEEIRGETLMRDCDLASGVSGPTQVQAASELPRPKLLESLCGDDTRVVAYDLYPDSIVTVIVDGVEVGQAGVSSQTQAFEVPGLRAGNRVAVRQELCSHVKESPPLTVAPRSTPGRPRIDPIPYECSTKVHVVNVLPTATVRLISELRGIIGQDTADADEVTFSVPALRPEEPLYVTQTACGQTTSPGSPILATRVYPTHIPAPTVRDTPLEGDRGVRVEEVRPGAVVEVFVDGQLRGSTVVAEERGIVGVVPPLVADSRITVRQRLCDRMSDQSREVEVMTCRGSIRVGLKVLDAAFSAAALGQFRVARRRYAEFGVRLLLANERPEALDLPFLRTPSDGGCRRGNPSQDFRDLQANREGLNPTDVAAFVVERIAEGFDGCAAFDGEPALVIASRAHLWALAHELGHVVGGLTHEDQDGNSLPSSNLMFAGARLSSPSTVDVEPWQASAIISGPYTHPC